MVMHSCVSFFDVDMLTVFSFSCSRVLCACTVYVLVCISVFVCLFLLASARVRCETVVQCAPSWSAFVACIRIFLTVLAVCVVVVTFVIFF